MVRDADDLHCVISWSSRREGFVPSQLAIVNRRGGPLLCTNPLTWRTDETFAPASANHGAVFLASLDVPVGAALAEGGGGGE